MPRATKFLIKFAISSSVGSGSVTSNDVHVKKNFKNKQKLNEKITHHWLIQGEKNVCADEILLITIKCWRYSCNFFLFLIYMKLSESFILLNSPTEPEMRLNSMSFLSFLIRILALSSRSDIFTVDLDNVSLLHFVFGVI